MRLLVTGVSDGIGGSTCLRFASAAQQSGDDLRIVATSSGRKPPPSQVLDQLRFLGADVLHVSGDLSDQAFIRELADLAVDHCGSIDCFVSNAGMIMPSPLSSISVDEWNYLFAVNVTPTLLLSQYLHTALRASSGSVVVVASMVGTAPHRGSGAYSTSKSALIMLARQLAQEWALDHIRVNVVAPGMVITPLSENIYRDPVIRAKREASVPMGRMGMPQDIADAVYFLGTEAASYITGQVLIVDGGFSDGVMNWMPNSTDHTR